MPPTVRTVYRHALPVRATHGLIALSLFVLLLSGFQIFNAHPKLYWGEGSSFADPVLSIDEEDQDDGTPQGLVSIGEHSLVTTGVFGISSDANGTAVNRAFPSWLTIPGPVWLAAGRRWHFLFGWVLGLAGLAYLGYAVRSGHIRRDLVPTGADWRGLGRSVVDHMRLRHPQGEASARYNILQRLSYLGVVFGLVPLLILTGLAMSPRLDTLLWPFLSLVGGRQSARTVHFAVAFLLVAFVGVHLFEVVITGVVNNLRSIITGRFRYTLAEVQEVHDDPSVTVPQAPDATQSAAAATTEDTSFSEP